MTGAEVADHHDGWWPAGVRPVGLITDAASATKIPQRCRCRRHQSRVGPVPAAPPGWVQGIPAPHPVTS